MKHVRAPRKLVLARERLRLLRRAQLAATVRGGQVNRDSRAGCTATCFGCDVGTASSGPTCPPD